MSFLGLGSSCILQWHSILNVNTCLIGGSHKFGNISTLTLEQLHWLQIRERILFMTLVLACHCLLGCAPIYSKELCVLITIVSGYLSRDRQHTETVSWTDFQSVPSTRTATIQRSNFTVVGPASWNALAALNFLFFSVDVWRPQYFPLVIEYHVGLM